MTGLDLESFLKLLRADLSAWILLGPVLLGLGLLAWSCWGSRRALRKCLVLSLAVHFGLVLYGSTIPAVRSAFGGNGRATDERTHMRQVRVTPLVESEPARQNNSARVSSGVDGGGNALARLDLTARSTAVRDVALTVPRPKMARLPELASVGGASPVAAPIVIPTRPEGLRATAEPEARPAEPSPKEESDAPLVPVALAADLERESVAGSNLKVTPAKRVDAGISSESATRPDISFRSDRRLRPSHTDGGGRDRAGRPKPAIGVGVGVSPAQATPNRPAGAPASTEARIAAEKVPNEMVIEKPTSEPFALARATPTIRSTPMDRLTPLGLGELPTGRVLTEIPRVYQPRIEPDRSERARRSGASVQSELAVERALDWLTRHQDGEDGRWDAGVARYDDGSPVKGDDDFTKHCPPGETCFGECAYWEADTAVTGLALLTYLGAGYTHTRGRYAKPVDNGLNFLLSKQKPDGDLRGESAVVGMYCHAMATLALCEAYALTGDSKLNEPTDRAVAFLVRARARDGLAWRYAPGAPVGDTSILGWVVMGLKSAKETRITIPNEDLVRRGTLEWLDKVATGSSKGLARYQPWDPVTPTMTAEAWVCRQFIGVGGPGASSSEAAEYLLRNDSDRGKTNVYYWYYATLALYQHGGEPWIKWNAKIRDRVVNLQRRSGHQSGSWDPDESLYGSKGGRIYCTALAALTLEVYYRYLRLYDAPKLPTDVSAMRAGKNEGFDENAVPPIQVGNPEDQ